jgi:predicted DNA-binding protein (MmcQ/YjbR family)
MPAKSKIKDLEARLRTFALAFPETDEAFPWGERALRVRKKAFVFMRAEDGVLSFSVKLADSRKQALALPFVEPTHYGLGKHGWVTVEVKKPTKALADQCEEWIEESYRSVAPARLVKSLLPL